MVITRRRHPFEGCRLAVINGLTRHGVPLLLVVLPDGSRSSFRQPGRTGLGAVASTLREMLRTARTFAQWVI